MSYNQKVGELLLGKERNALSNYIYKHSEEQPSFTANRGNNNSCFTHVLKIGLICSINFFVHINNVLYSNLNKNNLTAHVCKRKKKESQHDRGHMLFMGGIYGLTSCITALKRADEDN